MNQQPERHWNVACRKADGNVLVSSQIEDVFLHWCDYMTEVQGVEVRPYDESMLGSIPHFRVSLTNTKTVFLCRPMAYLATPTGQHELQVLGQLARKDGQKCLLFTDESYSAAMAANLQLLAIYAAVEVTMAVTLHCTAQLLARGNLAVSILVESVHRSDLPTPVSSVEAQVKALMYHQLLAINLDEPLTHHSIVGLGPLAGSLIQPVL